MKILVSNSYSIIDNIIIYNSSEYNNIYFYWYLSPLVIVGVISIFIFFYQLNLKENYFSKVAYLTFGIYLIHPGVLYAIDFVINYIHLSMFQNIFVIIPLKLTISFFISLILAKAFSKIKFLNRTI